MNHRYNFVAKGTDDSKKKFVLSCLKNIVKIGDLFTINCDF